MTFTLQVSKHVPPIRGKMRASTLKSSKWRCMETSLVLQKLTKHILVIQLQGQLFFGNGSTISVDIEDILINDHNPNILYIILDFTLVLAIDSSAAEIIANIYHICKKYNVKLCYSRPSKEGFPCAVELTDRLNRLAGESGGNHNKGFQGLSSGLKPLNEVDIDDVDVDGSINGSSEVSKPVSPPSNKSLSSVNNINLSNDYMRNNGFLSRNSLSKKGNSSNKEKLNESISLHGGVITPPLGYQSISQSDESLNKKETTGTVRDMSARGKSKIDDSHTMGIISQFIVYFVHSKWCAKTNTLCVSV